MTVLGGVRRFRGYFNQTLMVILINVPTVSFGLAMGWVSLASGEGDGEGGDGGGGGGGGGQQLVVAAATTFGAQLLGVLLSARAAAAGRKFAVVVTSAAFVVCWSLKLLGGGWCMVLARAAAGLGGAGAWTLAPLLAREMCESKVRGAAVSALVLAHNLGFLLMYLAADARVPHRTVLWACLGLSAAHCVLFLFVPESPAYLAANGKADEARSSLSWLRGLDSEDPELLQELTELPSPEEPVQSPLKLTKEMLSDRQRRRAFVVSAIAVVGQESCGVFALLQFAERVFVLARDQPGLVTEEPVTQLAGFPLLVTEVPMANPNGVGSPARLAVILGAVQLVASALALYLVERVGRRPLIVITAALTCFFLGSGAGAVRWGGAGGPWAAALLAAAVAADSGGLQPAPYALLADMFHYQYRGCALMLVTAAGCVGNALEVFVFPAVAAAAGVSAALALAAALTGGYAVFAAVCVPETRGRSPEQIYERLCAPSEQKCDSVAVQANRTQCKSTVWTSM